MSGHSPEPWTLERSRDGAVWINGKGSRYACSFPAGKTNDEAEANARRIVAAVNACTGIPQEELERLGPASIINTPAGRAWVLEAKP